MNTSVYSTLLYIVDPFILQVASHNTQLYTLHPTSMMAYRRYYLHIALCRMVMQLCGGL